MRSSRRGARRARRRAPPDRAAPPEQIEQRGAGRDHSAGAAPPAARRPGALLHSSALLRRHAGRRVGMRLTNAAPDRAASFIQAHCAAGNGCEAQRVSPKRAIRSDGHCSPQTLWISTSLSRASLIDRSRWRHSAARFETRSTRQRGRAALRRRPLPIEPSWRAAAAPPRVCATGTRSPSRAR